MTPAHLARRGNSAHDALRRAMVQRLPGTLRARQAKLGSVKVDKPFACVRLFNRAAHPTGTLQNHVTQCILDQTIGRKLLSM